MYPPFEEECADFARQRLKTTILKNVKMYHMYETERSTFKL